MTDRHTGYMVVLEDPIREDDAEAILSAIRQIRGVIEVTPVLGNPVHEAIAASRERRNLLDKMLVIFGVAE